MNKKPHITNPTEFVLLMAAMMSLVSLTIDAMLPAFNAIAADFQLTNPNDIQLVIAVVFVGMACGIFIYGPLADSYGRKKICYFALCLFAIGTILSIIAQDYTTMLIGRFIQGFGIAAPRVLAFTMVRDKFEGVMVAKITSFIILVFIAMPAIAPAFGQLILLFSGWRMIFVSFLVLTFIVTCWYAWRQEETLHPEYRRPFSVKSIMQAMREIFANKKTIGYSVALGLMFAAFLNYLNSTQQIFQNQYDTGNYFPLYFASIALFFGVSSLVNTRLVDKIEMKTLSLYSFIGVVIVSAIFLVVTIYGNGSPPLWSLMIFLYITAFFAGILVSNLTTMAILPMGHLAGIASSVITALATMISVIIGTILSQLYDGTLYSLVGGYLLTCAIGLIMTHRTNKI
ncbi:MAG: multidrug effflux MFS transporter [Alphaproteobacteria bacterium]|nr:multidrug effflux MFS transporter [Alphaproteobacteria bacterium]